MLSAEQMKTLKKVSVSKDNEKSKARLSEDYKSTTKENKAAISELSGFKAQTFYSVFASGKATAKVVLSVAQVLDVSPFYYTGETDEKAPFTEELLNKFLKKHKYTSLLKPKRQYNRKPKNESVVIVEEETNVNESITYNMAEVESSMLDRITYDALSFNNLPKMREAVANMDFETATVLLKALMLRAEAGGDAEEYYDLVKRCLLS